MYVCTSVQYSIQKYDHLTPDRVMTANIKSHLLHFINACVAHGGWVPRNLGAGAADPNPGSKSTPKACPTRNQPRAPPAIPSPSPSTRHTEPELHGNIDNSNN